MYSTMIRYFLVVLYLLLYSSQTNSQRRDWAKERPLMHFYDIRWPQRTQHYMIQHAEDLARHIESIREIRFVYEESARYEIGYVMCEILDRYEKMVNLLRHPMTYKSTSVVITIQRLGFIQKLYFEIYHLVRMLHEIPRKYGYSDDMSKQDTEFTTQAYDEKKEKEIKKKLINDQKERERRKRKRLREMKKLRELMLKGKYHTVKTRRPKNRWWPIDYGWEIDYYWK